jgi:AcrR family transcriptional regulator
MFSMQRKSRKDTVAKPGAYHHGDLVTTLLAATTALVEERGVEGLSLREVSKRAGVSPGAPFRHFSTKKALLTAVAEQAMDRLSDALTSAQTKLKSADPAAIYEAIGVGYLDWALSNPTHFQIISSRTIIDFDASSKLVDQNAAIRDRMVDLLLQAQQLGQLPPAVDLNLVILSSRAFTYGLARMAIDGHLSGWHPRETPKKAMRGALRLFMTQLFVPHSR